MRNGVAVVARAALAAVAPDVTTGSASDVSSSGATLGGSVTPEGLDTTYSFEYGTSPTALSSTTPSTDAGDGTGTVPVAVGAQRAPCEPELLLRARSDELVGHDRRVARAVHDLDARPSSGRDDPAPVTTPIVSTGQATAVTATGATFGGTVNPNGIGTSYSFLYGTTPADLTQSTPSTDAGSGTTAVPASATVTGLTPNETYYFALVATNSSGTTDGSTALSRRASSPSPPPAAPRRSPPARRRSAAR